MDIAHGERGMIYSKNGQVNHYLENDEKSYSYFIPYIEINSRLTNDLMFH